LDFRHDLNSHELFGNPVQRFIVELKQSTADVLRARAGHDRPEMSLVFRNREENIASVLASRLDTGDVDFLYGMAYNIKIDYII
jgi:hypothetical protein